MTSSEDRGRIKPSKRLGQNFLQDNQVARRIVNALGPTSDETIVEIGPGTGALTREIVARAGRVVAIEFDWHLVDVLNDSFSGKANFHLVQGDALDIDFCQAILPSNSARLVANLPYNISTAVLQKLIVQRHCITEMVLMLQLEVVERMLAPAGSSERGYLSVLVDAYCESEKLFDVAPGAFKPQPKVWSSVVRLKFKTQPIPASLNEKLLWSTVSAGFAQKRKTILNNLRNAPGHLKEVIQKNGGASIVLCKAEVELQRRAETLTVDEWVRIVEAME
jgi:16S rRNA (adenine1518-N6/adenine1519-N6)-dimethyltransferase